MRQRVTLAQSIYPRPCLDKAILAYDKVCRVLICNVTASACVVEIEKHSPEVDDATLRNEFLNYLLDVSLEHQLGGQ
jgi:hypothetical protein